MLPKLVKLLPSSGRPISGIVFPPDFLPESIELTDITGARRVDAWDWNDNSCRDPKTMCRRLVDDLMTFAARSNINDSVPVLPPIFQYFPHESASNKQVSDSLEVPKTAEQVRAPSG